MKILNHKINAFFFFQLSAVSLSFFETLIGLNCEDVMLWLIFKHLIPQTAFLPSQRPTIRHPDIHGRAAEKLLRLTPICCLEARNANILGNLNSSSNSGTNGKITDKRRDVWSRPSCIYTQIFSPKKTGFSPIKNNSQHFFVFCLPLFYATFQ